MSINIKYIYENNKLNTTKIIYFPGNHNSVKENNNATGWSIFSYKTLFSHRVIHSGDALINIL